MRQCHNITFQFYTFALPVTLGDIATVVVTDNADQLYTKVNGGNGILLSFTKQSNYCLLYTSRCV